MSTTPRLCLLAADSLRSYLRSDARDLLESGEMSQHEYDTIAEWATRLESATSLDEVHDVLCEAWQIADGL